MYIKEIGIKLIFSRYASLDWDDCCKIEVALVADGDDISEKKD